MVNLVRRSIVLCGFVVLSACGGDGVVGPVTIGPAGGTISLGSGAVVLVFPAGAVSEDVTLTATQVSGPTSTLVVTGTVWDIVMSPALTLAQPVAVTIQVGSPTLPTGVTTSELRLFTVVSGTGGDQWQMVPGSTYNASDNTITASITSFSVYGILGVPAATVTIASANTNLTVGGTVDLSASAVDASATPLPGRAFTWSSTNSTVASVNAGTGLVTANAAGSANIVAYTENASDTVAVTVTGGGGGGAAWLEESFIYASTLDMMNDPRNIYTQNEDLNPQLISLDTAGFDATSNSMRFDYPDRTGVGGSGTTGRCGEINIGRNLTLPSPVTEIWAEFWVRFSANFTTIAPAAWSCTSGPSLKLIFGRVPTSGRFSLEFENSAPINWTLSAPGLAEDFWKASTVTFPPFDGQWHRIRLHYKLSSTPTSADGGSQFWLDNTLASGDMNQNTVISGQVPSDIYGLALGRNLNQGPGQAQSLWWSRIRVYNTNPGW